MSWKAILMLPKPTDTKGLYLYSECDKGGTDLAASAPAFPGTTMLIVGDLNHAEPHPVYPVVFDGSADQNYLLQWKDGPNYCPVGGPGVSGVINTTSTGCNLLEVYDIELQGGLDYRVRFYETGDADIHVALYRNLDGDVEYWGSVPTTRGNSRTPRTATCSPPLRAMSTALSCSATRSTDRALTLSKSNATMTALNCPRRRA